MPKLTKRLVDAAEIRGT
jgi:integrase